MQFLPVLPVSLIVLVLSFMGFLVIRNSREAANKLFLIFILIDIVWLVSVAMVIHSSLGENVYLSRVTYASALALTVAIQSFINALFQIRRGKLYEISLYWGGIFLVIMTCVTPLIIQGVDVKGSLPFPQYGVLYPLFVAFLIGSISTFLVTLFRQWKTARKTGDASQRKQIDVVFFGFTIFASVSLLTNFILPAVFTNSWSSQFGPLGSLILASTLFYAISKYRLFDVKTAVLRGTTYVFLGASLALIFVGLVSFTTTQFTIFRDHQYLQIGFNAIVALVMAVSFQPLRRLFDRLTNKYFFRDSYDTKEVLDSLNRILIGNADVSRLLNLSEHLLIDRLKLEFCFFVLGATGDTKRIFSTVKSPLTEQEILALPKSLFTSRTKMVLTGDRSTQQKDRNKMLAEKQVSAVVKMIANNDLIGYMVLGNKKSGSPLSPQDVGVIAIAANQLAIATQNVLRFEQIQNFNATLQDKVEDATHELQQKNKKLRLLDQTKDDFISMASHQLRTPLTSVKGYVSMVLDGDAGKVSPLQRKLLNQAFISSQRMVYLISDLLNVSRLSTGKFELEPVPSNLANVVREEVEQLHETAKGRNLTLVYHKPEHFPVLMLDEGKLRQVIMNFIDNAIYYTPSGGKITISLTDNPQSVELTVTDTGIGVPRQEQHHLFTKFYRAHNAKRMRPDGTGLGLFMAKKVIIAQGGAIIFRSQENRGSTFGFTFPKQKLLPKEGDALVGEAKAKPGETK